MEYLKHILCCKFTLSPPGRGFDCHRTWEALYLGRIPVILSSAMDPMFDDLPVLVVNNWKEVTRNFLEKKYVELSQREYNYDKLNIDYWLNLIKSYK